MSKERELLEQCRMYLSSLGMFVEHSTLINEIDELLTQPEQTAPPEREPLTRQQISVGNQSMLNVTREAFVNGIKFAEKMHGIGGEDE